MCMSEVGLQLFPYGKIIVKFGYQGYADLVKGDWKCSHFLFSGIVFVRLKLFLFSMLEVITEINTFDFVFRNILIL